MTDLPIAEVYIDESSQNGHRYLVLGGIIAETNDSLTISERVRLARLPELPGKAIKWRKVSRAMLPVYKRAVDVFFDTTDCTLHFHSLYVDTTKQKHHIYNQSSRDVGFNKELYQLSMKFGRLYGALLHIYPDRRTTQQSTDELRLMLNRGIAKRYNDTRDWPFRRVQFREPEESQLLQLADIFSGAIAWQLNGHGKLPGASPWKSDLSAYILARAGIRDVVLGTNMRRKFTIWPRRLQP